jgi:hypothetical protein
MRLELGGYICGMGIDARDSATSGTEQACSNHMRPFPSPSPRLCFQSGTRDIVYYRSSGIWQLASAQTSRVRSRVVDCSVLVAQEGIERHYFLSSSTSSLGFCSWGRL